MDINYYKKYEPIDGKWYFTKKLGSGAFGTVFEIERRDFTNDKSALKIITIPATSGEVESYREENYDLDEQSISSYFYGFVEEFIKEFQMMSKLKGNSNIISIEDYDVKEHEDEVGWDIFIRMELLTPMNKHFAKNVPKTKDVIKLGIDICKALEVCQKFNIVHRDIKPSNIFVSDTGEFKLGDFGVARTLEKTSSGLSKKGTYTYMAPEVYKGEAYSSNVDIYSLGIVMYKLLNNNMEPFKQGRTHEDDEKALVARLKGEPMPKPANADGRLAEIILKACAFNPKDRYESPLHMREELENILYSENEKKNLYLKGEELDFEPSVKSETEEPDTSGIFVDRETEVVDEDKTVGIFDKNTKGSKAADSNLTGTPLNEMKAFDCDSSKFTDEEKLKQCQSQEREGNDDTKPISKRNIIKWAIMLIVTIVVIIGLIISYRHARKNADLYKMNAIVNTSNVIVEDAEGFVVVNASDVTQIARVKREFEWLGIQHVEYGVQIVYDRKVHQPVSGDVFLVIDGEIMLEGSKEDFDAFSGSIFGKDEEEINNIMSLLKTYKDENIEYQPGLLTTTYYESEFVGIKWAPPEGWYLRTQEEMDEIVSAESRSKIEFMCYNTLYDAKVVLSVRKMPPPHTTVDSYLDQVEEDYSNTTYINSWERGKRTIAGQEYKSFSVNVNTNGDYWKQVSYLRKDGDYLIELTLSEGADDSLDYIFDGFSEY